MDVVLMYGLEASLLAAPRPTSSVKRLRCSALTGFCLVWGVTSSVWRELKTMHSHVRSYLLYILFFHIVALYGQSSWRHGLIIYP